MALHSLPHRVHWLMIRLLALTTLLLLQGCSGGSSSESASAAAVSISGTVQAASGTVIDSDVNDPEAPFKSNDIPADAQPIPNPAVVGGYASWLGAGEPGSRFKLSGDTYDAYEVLLTEGQTISLTLADFNPLVPQEVDLDLWLYDATDPSTPVDDSLSVSETESVQAPYSGVFHVVIEAWEGASNYILTVGQSPLSAATTQHPVSSTDAFIPGELILTMNDFSRTAAKSPLATQRQQKKDRLSGLGLKPKAGDLDRAMLLELGDAEQRQATLTALSSQRSLAQQRPWGYGAREEKIETIRLLKSLQSQPEVKSAGLNYIRTTQAIPNDPYYPLQWHYPLINLPQAWDLSNGSAVIVAVIDTGVYRAHPDLAANLTSTGYDFIASSAMSNDGDGIDDNPDDPGDGMLAGQSSFHGTHVAGTIAATSNNASGVAGVATSAKVMPIRALGKGGGTSYDILQGIRYAARLSNDSGTLPSTRADIINMSLGGPGFSQVMKDTITQARNEGCIIIAAAGNEGSSQAFYPAAYDGVVSVSAVRYDKTLSRYSNFGSSIDLSAPGGDSSVDQNGDGYPDGIFSTLADTRTGSRQPSVAFSQGTSMAAPHVAGVAALMRSLHPALTPANFDAAIVSGQITQDLGNDGAATRNNQYGYGLIDALKAVQYASALAGGAQLPALISIDQSTLTFGATLTELTLIIGNAGQRDLFISSVLADRSWLTATAEATDSSNLGTYRVTVDRSGLTAGQYRGNIQVSSDTAGTVTLPVILNVSGAISSSADVGLQWVLLIDAISLETIDSQPIAAADGRYNYNFLDVAAGDYYILSGSDSDNDFLICDAGESCGGYPLPNQPQIISISNDVTDLNFDSSFGVGFSAQTVSDIEAAGIRRKKLTKKLSD